MRCSRLLIVAAAVLATALPAASPAAFAAPKSNKPARGTYLRYDPGPPPVPVRPTTPVPSGRLALGGQMAGLKGLTGLPTAVDTGGQCRTRCARERYACEAGGDDCGPGWAACLRPCGAGAPR